eukprot:GEMP01120718.1.p3 GENE.GEMP01120718.1~~GEMP01120718.1.p3  ORF type:complete len:114 (+),score=51.68 GEMP01120718.1:163-504(+)
MGMKYVGSYLLAVLGGNDSPSVEDIEKILDAAGLECDKKLATLVVENMKGKSAQEVIAAGHGKLEKLGGGGGGSAPAAGGAGGGGDAGGAAVAKKEEKVEEEEEEEMEFDLFG